MKAIGLIGLLPVYVVLRGWALSIMWGWFVSPYFDISGISVPQAIGLVFMYYLVSPDQRRKGSSEEAGGESSTTTYIASVLAPLVSLLLGWIVTLFM